MVYFNFYLGCSQYKKLLFPEALVKENELVFASNPTHWRRQNMFFFSRQKLDQVEVEEQNYCISFYGKFNSLLNPFFSYFIISILMKEALFIIKLHPQTTKCKEQTSKKRRFYKAHRDVKNKDIHSTLWLQPNHL